MSPDVLTHGTPVDLWVSIIVDDNRAGLEQCLASLGDAAGDATWRATVVDNHCSDGSASMVTRCFPEVAVIRNAQRQGFAANHNMVLRQALAEGSARYLLVLNDDCHLSSGCLGQLVDAMDADPAIGAMAPTVLDGLGRQAAMRLEAATARTSWRFDWRTVGERADPAGWLQGCCTVLRPATLRQVGLYDERFFLFYEDNDLSRRLLEGGWELGVCATAPIIHDGHASVLRPEFARFTPRQGLHSRYLFFEKYRGRRSSLAIAAVGRAVMAVRAMRMAYTGLRRGDMAWLRGAAFYAQLAWYDPRRPPPLPERPARAPGQPTDDGEASSRWEVDLIDADDVWDHTR